MEKNVNISSSNELLFRKAILSRVKGPRPICVNCNNVKTIITSVLEVAKEVNTHQVYYQPNMHFYSDLKLTELTTYEYYEEKFKAYCDYFDKFKEKQIMGGIIKLYNYSKNQERVVYTEYPTNVNMILIIENFNFYDFNSQCILAEMSEDFKNILMICQIRNDFEFVKNHIDIGIKTGKGGGVFLNLS